MVTAGFDVADSPAPPAVRRFLTLMFSDLCGSTQLAAAIEAELYADIIGQLRQAYRSVIQRHGGTVVRIQGDGVLAIFGHPEAFEDDQRTYHLTYLEPVCRGSTSYSSRRLLSSPSFRRRPRRCGDKRGRLRRRRMRRGAD